MISEKEIWQALEVVKDPEIPTLSMVDMGIITKVEIRGESNVFVEMTPTFTGCPAIKMMESMVSDRLKEIGIVTIEVKTTFDTPWNSNKLTERGLLCLKKHGLAPPPKHNGATKKQTKEQQLALDAFAWFFNVSTSVLIVFVNKQLMSGSGLNYRFGT